MDKIAHNAVWVDVGEANMKQYREIGHKSNTRAPVQMLTPVPTRNNGGAVSRCSVVLKRANAQVNSGAAHKS